MFTTFFQSIGIVFSCVLLLVLTLVTLYLSYILAIGVLLVGSVYIIYTFLAMYKSGLT